MDLDLYTLRVFSEVVKQGSFSAAARVLRITQPAVSKKIAAIEREIGAKLFTRMGHDVHLTDAGRDFAEFATELVEKAQGFLEKQRLDQGRPTGLVRYAMPESCQWTPHYRKIMAQIGAFPEIRFDIAVLPNVGILEGIMNGTFDFGFVTGERLAPELRFEKFSDESYSAVGASDKLFQPLVNKKPGELRLISYPGWELFFTTWAKAHGLWVGLKDHLTSPTVRIATLAGAIHAAQEGAGLAVVPTHCVVEDLGSKRLREFSVKKGAIASNPIHLTRRLGEKLPRRVELVIEMLREAKLSL